MLYISTADKLKTTKDKIVELEQKEEEYKKRIRDLENQNVNLQKVPFNCYLRLHNIDFSAMRFGVFYVVQIILVISYSMSIE